MNPTVKQMLGESREARPVIVKQRSVDYQVCPHCNEEIHEKSLYMAEGSTAWQHTCGGLVELPPPDYSNLHPMWRALLKGKQGA